MALDFDVIVIGSGFGAAVAAIDQAGKGKTVFILERGVWWLTPELSAENPMNPFLKTQPVQYWPRPDHRRGLVDFLAVVKANGVAGALQDFGNGVAEFFTGKERPRPLYRYSTFEEADVISASGVGGGSLIYSNVTIEPFFDTDKKQYPAMESWPEKAKLLPADYTNGLAWMTTNRGAPNQVVTKYPQAIPQDQLKAVNSSDPRLLGRSRFLRDASTSPNLSAQLAGQIVEPWAPLKLQIKEADPGNTATNKNFCERQGRCFLGCLPAARHTLNKTLLNQLPLAAQDKGSWFSSVLFSVCRAAGKQPRKHRPWRSQKFLFVAVFPGSASFICSFKGAQGSTICPASCAERFGLVEASLKNRERPSNLGSLLLTAFS